MPRKKPPSKAATSVEQPEPIVLVGLPDRLRGELQLFNTGEERMVFRGAEVRSAAPPKAAGAGRPISRGAALPESVLVSHRLPSVTVRPGERRRVPLRFKLAPTTPPGEYHAEVKMGDQTWPVVLHVTENVALDISPEQVVLHNDPGATVNKTVILSNLGNTPLEIEELSAVPLDDELLQCRILRAVVASVGEEKETTLDHVLAEFAHASRAALSQAGILRVRNLSGPFTLQPGEVRPVEFEFRLPDSLDKRARYTGLLPIYDADLDVLVVPSFDVQTPKKRSSA